MDTVQLLSRLAVALGIGLLIGLERGWKTREVLSGRRAAGLGLADVDAVTISLACLVPVPLDLFAASLAILAAVASNMLSKLVIAIAIGRGHFALEVAVVTVACWIAGAGALWGAMATLAAPIAH